MANAQRNEEIVNPSADPNITPANYANTGGLQNQYIIATAPTGLTEAGRETVRTFNRWERAQFDITGSLGVGDTIVTTPIVGVTEISDIGSTTATAALAPFQLGQTSGMQLSLIVGDLDTTASDSDWYRIAVAGAPIEFSAENFSLNLVAAPFNSRLRLLASDGTTVVASNDDIQYAGNTFDAGGVIQLDPFLLNIVLNPGTYYLAVEPVSLNALSDDYVLLMGMAAVPEPTSLAAVTMLGAGLIARRRFRA